MHKNHVKVVLECEECGETTEKEFTKPELAIEFIEDMIYESEKGDSEKRSDLEADNIEIEK